MHAPASAGLLLMTLLTRVAPQGGTARRAPPTDRNGVGARLNAQSLDTLVYRRIRERPLCVRIAASLGAIVRTPSRPLPPRP